MHGPDEINDVIVSVIIPIYNVENYLEDCLNSVERQTLQNIEVILVNDGSTDASGKIAEKYAARNSRFRFISKENGGLSAARNCGLKYASGKYIFFLDSDDYIVHNALEKMCNKAEIDRLDALKFSAYTFIDGNNENMEWKSYVYKGQYQKVCTGIELLGRMRKYGDNFFPSCCMILMRRDFIKKHELKFYEGIIHEDNLFHWELMALAKRTEVLNEPLYCRRIREGSITTTQQYYNSWRSLVISTVAADKFFHNHKELIGTDIQQDYHTFLITGIFSGYVLMNKQQRKTDESRKLHTIERAFLRKWHEHSSVSICLYRIHPDIYLFCRSTLLKVTKIGRKICKKKCTHNICCKRKMSRYSRGWYRENYRLFFEKEEL